MPHRFAGVADAVDRACAELGDPAEPFRAVEPGQWVRRVGAASGGPVRDARFVLDLRARVLVVYVELALPDTGVGAGVLAETTARANDGLVPACFELDVDSRQVHCRNVLALGERPAELPEVARLLADAIGTAAAYAPAFAAVAEGEAEPRAAIEGVRG